MEWKSLASSVADWTIPPALQRVIHKTVHGQNGANPNRSYTTGAEVDAVLKRNQQFRNKHRGQRCFVLATGPSIREQDLRPLRKEWCIGVSEFYKHERYRLIKPAYYAFAANHPPFTDDDMLRQLHEMKQQSQNETFFFALKDRTVAERSDLLSDWCQVHYIDFCKNWSLDTIDLTARVRSPCGAGFMATIIAIYMGFSEIYLVGCDHDHLWKWDGVTPFTRHNYYGHFYDGEPAMGYEPMDVDQELKSTLKTREEYKWAARVAQRQGSRIYNANPRNYLGVVPRVSLAELF